MIIGVLSSTFALRGQTEPNSVFSHRVSSFGSTLWTPIDTAFELDPLYRQEPLLDDWFGYIPIGNQGAARQSLRWEDRQQIGGHFGHPSLDLRFRKPQDWPTYQVRSPLSEADYRHGYGRGQLFHIFFTQNVHERWNFLVDFSRLNSFGRYVRQQVQQSDLLFTTRYSAPDSSYVLFAGFNSGLIEAEVSGGLAFDTVFSSGSITDEELVPVVDSNATQFMRNRRLYFDQSYRPFARADSSSAKTWYSGIGLRHRFDYWRQSYVFDDLPDGDQEPPLLQDNITADSTAFERVRNEVSALTGGSLGLEVGLWNETYLYEGVNHRLRQSNTAVKAALNARILQKLPLRSEAEVVFQGERSGDFRLRVETGLESRAISLLPYAELVRSQPGLFMSRYTSNYRSWNRGFDPQVRTEFGLQLKQPFLGLLKFRALVMDAPVYLSPELIPTQSQEALSYIGLEWKARYALGAWRMGTDLILQSAGGEKEALSLPAWYGRISANGQYRLFSGKLQMQPGISVWAFSSYQMMEYRYELDVFTTQNQQTFSSYPWVDVFVNFKLEEVSFFFELEHINALWDERDYWAAPGHPLTGFAIRTGIRWRFFN